LKERAATALADLNARKNTNVCVMNLSSRLKTPILRDTVTVCFIIRKNKGGYAMNDEKLHQIVRTILDIAMVLNCLAIIILLVRKICDDDEE
jgi:hypothetical protein